MLEDGTPALLGTHSPAFWVPGGYDLTVRGVVPRPMGPSNMEHGGARVDSVCAVSEYGEVTVTATFSMAPGVRRFEMVVDGRDLLFRAVPEDWQAGWAAYMAG